MKQLNNQLTIKVIEIIDIILHKLRYIVFFLLSR